VRAQLQARRGGILTYGITPPKRDYSAEKQAELASRQLARIQQLPIDALVIYDLQDEAARAQEARPFPYLECVDPTSYAFDALAPLTIEKVVYRCVAPLTRPDLVTSLKRIDANNGLSVLVGPASRGQVSRLKLPEGYEAARSEVGSLPIGGVLIAERHEQTQAEDERALAKLSQGCSFFISQAVYSVAPTKNLLSDLLYRSQAMSIPFPPVLVTLSPCGSLRTLDFMRWLGVSVPRWLENDLRHSKDILQASLKVCLDLLADLADFAAQRGIPLGCNVESVSLQKSEIEASVELLHGAARILKRG
jgi:hypothetical protein